MNLPPGLYDISAKDYHADPAEQISLSSSLAQTLISQSPLHAYTEHPRLGGVPAAPTDEMEFGDVCHQMFLGKGEGYSIWQGKTWAGKEAGAFWDEAILTGKTPIKVKDHARAASAVKMWRQRLASMNLGYTFNVEEGESEKVSIWKEREVWCRAMMDRVFIDRGEIVDLKTMSQSAHPKACQARIHSMGYDLRSEFYKRGIIAHEPKLNGRMKFLFLFAETSPPFEVTPVRMNGEWSTIGFSKAMRAMSLWGECIKNNSWPGYTDFVMTLEPPSYALNQEIANS